MPKYGDAKRADQAAHSREKQEHVREIGPPPPVVNQERRDACRHDLLQYLLTYHAEAFPLSFGPDHLELIKQTQRVILDGGQVVAAFPRGSGKTTIFQRAEIWAALYGHRKFPLLISADDIKFRQLLKGIKTVLENSELLLEDFPEVIHPIRSLERIALRANFQMCRKVPTYMRWGVEQVVFATTEESIARGNAGVVIGGGGLTGAAVRGGVVTLPSGQQVRPDCVLVDDPQTRKSAKSEAQNQEREDIINGDIMGMAGPGKTMSAMVACTVIYQGDLADRLLDRERSPHWTTLKIPMIKSWPKAMTQWEQYDAIRRQELMEEVERGSCTRFYEQNREGMDAGAVVYWEDRVLPGRLSALQSAMDDYFQDPRAFMAEKQNAPESAVSGDLAELNPLDLVRRISTTKRGEVPAEATTITAHVDVQAKILFWSVVAWSQAFGGVVIDYGTTPRQNRRHFTLRDVKDLTKHYQGMDEPGALRLAISETIQALAAKTYVRLDGAEMKIDRGLVDARWNTEAVEAGLQLAQCGQWMPSYGVGIRAKDAPISQWTKKRGVKRGNNLVIQKPDRRLFMSVFYDTNHWKSEVHQALHVPPAHTQSITLYKETQSHHQMYVDHLTAERAVRVEARGRIKDEWDLPGGKDNHYWDTLVGAAVAASICGIKKEIESEQRTAQQPQRRVVGKRVAPLKL
jgi:Phage terminase large subunit (GpA)